MKVLNFTIGISFLLCGCGELNQSSRNKEILNTSVKIERVVTLTSLSTDIVSKISIKKANHLAILLKLPFKSYISTLKEKLGWSGKSKEA